MQTSFPAAELLDGILPEYDAKTLLTSLGFRDWQAALRNLKYIATRDVGARPLLEAILPHLLTTLSSCADPDQSLINFERFATSAHAGEIFYKLKENPRTIEILVAVFAGSQFLTEILVRYPRHLDVLTNRERLAHQKSAQEFYSEAVRWMGNPDPHEQVNDLRRYQRGELLRIGASDLLDLYDLPAVTAQLSNLAEGMIRACLDYASERTSTDPAGFIVIAMGKLGGAELNYSSDIDLLFLCANNGVDYLRLGQQLIEALASMTSEGFLYRVDMRLRPWGRDGALVSSTDAYLGYLNKNARLWEKQALVKARPVAGNLALGDEFLKQIEPLIYGEKPEVLRTSVLAMKQRTEEILHSKGRDWGQVKLGEGSIRDVEFVVQYLQLAHGGANIKLRKKSTLQALRRLATYKVILPQEARVLTDGYIFLRTIEHFLQMMHYHQTYSLPGEPSAINLLARRLGFHSHEQFLERYQQHSHAIRDVYAKYIMDIQPKPEVKTDKPADQSTRQHMARMDTSYATAFSAEEISRHVSLAESLSDQQLVQVEASPLDGGRWKVTVVAYDYLGELSLICGLMFVYGLDIQAGEIFTYEAAQKPADESNSALRFSELAPRSPAGSSVALSTTRRKIVDVFTVQSVRPQAPDDAFWANYANELHDLLKMMHVGQRREARSKLAMRVGEVFAGLESLDTAPLYPIEISIDNELSDRYTVLHIETADTVGFLYEFTNALSLTHTYISRMVVHSSGRQVDDLLYVNDENGKKITSPEKLRELRTAAVLIKHFTHLLPRSPNPATALLHFREFLAQLFANPSWPDELASLERPEVIDNLARLLGVSDFLWDDFMRMQYANLFPVVSDTAALQTAKTRTMLQLDLETALSIVHLGPTRMPHQEALWRKTLNEFKDREMFRIDMRHILGHTKEFWDFSEELTDLTEVVVNSAFHLTGEDLRAIHGSPRLSDGSLNQMTVLALGKCGGRELGFASDIELMFVYSGEGHTDGSRPIAASVFFEKLVQNFLKAIRARQEGIYQVDLQLRPYGKSGSLAVSLDSFRRYYAPTGPAWAYERQALVKLRPIAGDEVLGEHLCSLRDEFTYNGAPFDVTAMRAMRERQVRHLVTAGKFNAKYSPGGLVDIEYLIQGLQITHGAANPDLRLTNIREAMAALNEAGILNSDDYEKLHKAHTFLRWLIDSMRVVRGNSKDVTVPPYGSEEFAFLARRLRYGNDIDRLRDDQIQYQSEVIEINRRLLSK